MEGQHDPDTINIFDQMALSKYQMCAPMVTTGWTEAKKWTVWMALPPSKSDFIKSEKKEGEAPCLLRSWAAELKAWKDEFQHLASHLSIITREFCSVSPQKLS